MLRSPSSGWDHVSIAALCLSALSALALTRLAQRMAHKEHPNSIRRCFKHSCLGRILPSGRTDGGPLLNYGPTPTDAVCPLGTYGDKGKAAWLRAAPTALLFEHDQQRRVSSNPSPTRRALPMKHPATSCNCVASVNPLALRWRCSVCGKTEIMKISTVAANCDGEIRRVEPEVVSHQSTAGS